MKRLLLNLFRIFYGTWRTFRKNNPKLEAFFYSLQNKKSFTNIDQHERMLADSIRMETYANAIQKHVKPGDTVVDLGTGTGILAFLAAQKEPKKVYAIDHGEVINFAKQLGKINNIQNVDFVKQHSTDFNPTEKVDIILHEQIGDFLINEDMVRNIVELRDRILKPGGKILPSLFEMYFEPIQLNEKRKIPFLWEHNFKGIDYSGMKQWLKGDQSTMSKPLFYNYIYPGEAEKFLATPRPILTFDLATITPESFPKSVDISHKIVNDGRFDGFALYFRIIFDEDNIIDNSPFEQATHWFPSIFRIEPRQLVIGDEISGKLHMVEPSNESLWDFEYQVNSLEATEQLILK